MLKKIILPVILLLSFVISIFICYEIASFASQRRFKPERYDNWKLENIRGFGDFQIPMDWYYSTDGKKILCTDKLLSQADYSLYVYGVVANLKAGDDISLPGREMYFVRTVSRESISGTDVFLGVDILNIGGEEKAVEYVYAPGKKNLQLYDMRTPKSRRLDDKDSPLLIKMGKAMDFSYINPLERLGFGGIIVILIIVDVLCFIYIQRHFFYKSNDKILALKDGE